MGEESFVGAAGRVSWDSEGVLGWALHLKYLFKLVNQATLVYSKQNSKTNPLCFCLHTKRIIDINQLNHFILVSHLFFLSLPSSSSLTPQP